MENTVKGVKNKDKRAVAYKDDKNKETINKGVSSKTVKGLFDSMGGTTGQVASSFIGVDLKEKDHVVTEEYLSPDDEKVKSRLQNIIEKCVGESGKIEDKTCVKIKLAAHDFGYIKQFFEEVELDDLARLETVPLDHAFVSRITEKYIDLSP